MFRKLVVVSLIVLFAAVPALADTQVDVYEGQKLVRSMVFVVGRAEYFVNGETPGVKMDVAPYIDQGRTFVPVRYLGYALGVAKNNVRWDGRQRKASLTLPPNTVEMVIGKKQVVANGQAKQIDVAPQLKDPGRTFLPARFVAEGLGYQVEWQNIGGKDYVICWPKGEARPDISAVRKYVRDNPLPQPQPNDGLTVKEKGQRLWEAAKPYVPVSFDTAKYKLMGRIGRSEVFQPGTNIMEVTVDDLKPNGVRIGRAEDHSALAGVMDLWVNEKENKVYMKQFATEDKPTPLPLCIVEPGWVVRLEISSAPRKFDTNPFVYEYDLEYTVGVTDEGIPYRGQNVNVVDVQGFLTFWGEDKLYIANPVYKGNVQ